MIWVFFIALFLVTIAGGLIPVYLQLNKEWNNYLLAFSGAILLGITFLHLLPETFSDLHFSAGIYILIGFFLQLFLQKFSHGLEHGHIHTHEHNHAIALSPILLGLSIHAFMEGIPLGYNFTQINTIPSLFLGVAAHKAPEALTLMSVVTTLPISKSKKISTLLQFAFITPLAGILAIYFGKNYLFINQVLTHFVPIVIGAFIHISTTIFFESGTKHHDLDFKKVLAIVAGLGLSLLTMLT
ncbi:MAG: ZIP family metal transporter [Chitinophagaceae bacterium]|jgi:zinc and cadmium transporter|nr:ZIP family metal transporter [Chitinophagaceae bacterium]